MRYFEKLDQLLCCCIFFLVAVLLPRDDDEPPLSYVIRSRISFVRYKMRFARSISLLLRSRNHLSLSEWRQCDERGRKNPTSFLGWGVLQEIGRRRDETDLLDDISIFSLSGEAKMSISTETETLYWPLVLLGNQPLALLVLVLHCLRFTDRQRWPCSDGLWRFYKRRQRPQ